jgi:hypothetical protein
MDLHLQATFVPIDKQPNDDVVHLDRRRKTDRFTLRTRNPRPYRQMFPLDLLRIAFTRLVCLRRERMPVGDPKVRGVSPDAKQLQPRFALHKYPLLATAKARVQDLATAVLDRVPAPSLLFFLADKPPHCIHFCFLNAPPDGFRLIRVQ